MLRQKLRQQLRFLALQLGQRLYPVSYTHLDHAPDDALRLWKRATNLDLLYTGELAKLSQLGLGDACLLYTSPESGRVLKI